MIKLLAVLIFLPLIGCTGGSLDVLSNRERSESEQTSLRTVSIELKSIAPDTFQPLIEQRRIIAEPLSVVPRTRLQVKYSVDGTEVVRYVDDCDVPGDHIPQPSLCAEVVQNEYVYGAIESFEVTDAGGMAELLLATSSYRLTAESVTTLEDPKCHWSGSTVVSSHDVAVELPLAVYCEAE